MYLRAILILGCLMQLTAGYTVTEKTEHLFAATAEQQPKEYRVSAPKPQRPENRVPLHLQGINRGYVYDDADDVIHIIEPPQHFRELKRLINQKGETAPAAADVWQQRSQVRIARPQLAATSTAASTKVKPTPQPDAAKVEMPLRLRNSKPVAISKNKRRGADLQTQESKVQPSQYEYIKHFNAATQAQQLPVEILASVRKTERLRHAQRPPTLPLVWQRHKSKKSHMVISEQGYAHEQFQRGKEMRLYAELQAKKLRQSRGQLRKSGRAKREIRQTTQATQAQQVTRNAYDTEKGRQLLEHINELLKNATYYLADESNGDVNATASATATSTATSTAAATPTTSPQNATLLHEFPALVEPNTPPKSLIGEIEPTQPLAKVLPQVQQKRQTLEENVLIRILESSLNATDLIMSGIMRQNSMAGNATIASSVCGNSGNGSRSNADRRFQSLQFRVDCMREQIICEIANYVAVQNKLKDLPIRIDLRIQIFTDRTAGLEHTTLDEVFSKTAGALKNTNKRFGERTREKVSTDSLLQTTTKSPYRRFKKLRNFTRLKNYLQNTTATTTTKPTQITNLNAVDKTTAPTHPPPPPTLSDADERNISAALLYDDIMTNIRNMLQARNLRQLEEEQQQTSSAGSVAAINIPFLDAAPPTEADVDESDFGNLRDLNRYLNELEQIVANLPQATSSESISGGSSTELTLNSHEFSSSTSGNGGSSSIGSTYPPRADWYLINGSGKIYETHLNDQLKPTATIFHRFPDIPNATQHLRNRSVWAQSKSFEIL